MSRIPSSKDHKVGMKALSDRKGKTPPAESSHTLIAYQISEDDSAPIRPAPRERKWMDNAYQKYPYRCLPLVVANQYGWEILSDPSGPRELGWHFESQGLVRRKPIRGWSAALLLTLRRGRSNFSNSIPFQDTRWLEFDGPWSYEHFERRNSSSRWHY